MRTLFVRFPFLIFFLVYQWTGVSIQAQTLTVVNPDKGFSVIPKTFIRDILGRDKLSPDYQMVAGKSEGDVYLYDLSNSSVLYLREKSGLDWINDFEWFAPDHLMLKGISGGVEKNTVINVRNFQTGEPSPGIPSESSLGLSVYSQFDETKNVGGIYLRNKGEDNPQLVMPGIFPVSLTLSAGNNQFAFLYLKENSSLCLGLFDIQAKTSKDLATDLDGSLKTAIAFDPEGKSILLSLVTDKLDPTKKYMANSDRDLDIYAVDVATGAIMPVIIEEGDDLFIGLNGNRMIWNKNLPMVRTCVIPADGSRVLPLVQGHSFLPSWNSKGNQLAVVFGDWRISDVPLNWDIGSFGVDKAGAVNSPLKPVSMEAREEYGPAWSADGEWILFSSRMPGSPFPTTASLESTEDVYIIKYGTASSSRITGEFVEVSDIGWLPDGKEIVVSAVKKGETISKLFRITLNDTKTSAESTTEIQPEGINHSVLSLACSPDGKMLACEIDMGARSRSLVTCDLLGKQVNKLAEFESLAVSSGLDFSVDGKSVIYAAFDGKHHQLFKISSSGGEPVKITDNPYDIIYPDVSPGGDWIAATLYRHVREIWLGEIAYE